MRYYHFLDGGGRRRRNYILAMLSLSFAVLLAVTSFASYKFYIKEGYRSKESAAVYNTKVDEDVNILGAEHQLGIEVSFEDVDPIRGIVKINSQLTRNTPAGEQSNLTDVYLLLGAPVSIPLSESSLMLDKETSFAVDGDVNRYPFDRYNAEIPFTATQGDVLKLGRGAKKVDFTIVAYGAMQNWRFAMQFEERQDLPLVMLVVNISRSPTTKGFSVFIVILMWMLSLAAVAVTFEVVVRQREASPPLLGMMVGLLFAMPAVRNTQPSVPPIGTLSDVVGLFFNMALVALSAICSMLSWVMSGPNPKPSPANIEAAGYQPPPPPSMKAKTAWKSGK